MNEAELQRRLMMALSTAGTRVFRNNVGQAWAGTAELCRSSPRTVTLYPGDVVIRNARPLHAGLCVGSSDLIGWNTVQITPEMVGRKVAAFTAVEVKTTTGRLTGPQEIFLNTVRSAGGIGIVARDVDSAVGALKIV